MVIKRCTEAEIETVGAFYDRNVENMDKCGTNYPKWQYRVYPTEASVREKTGAGAQYLCMSGGKICGAFVFNEDPEGAYEKAKWGISLKVGEYLVLHTLCIDYEEAHKGMGKQVVEFCIDYATKNGYKAVRIDVVPTNVPAIKLYERCGFRVTDTLDLDRNVPGIPEFTTMEYNIYGRQILL
ncbi:MAG: GNAT family N-acetyltransferase [Lachnospiraceae bacterium]